ncbi:uncharacterized protein AMSG_10729, partial [Thecamonas trahens ATCC 50062]
MLLSALPGSFALGASFACSAAFALRSTESFLVNEYATYTLLFQSMLMLPCMAYLSAAFPDWSLFFLTSGTGPLSPLWLALLLVGMVLSSLAGFARVWFRMRDSRNWFQLIAIHDEWILAYVVTFALVGLSHTRILFAGSSEQFWAGEEAGFALWFSSPQFYTLLGMALLMAPAVIYPLLVWPAHNGDHVPHTYSIAVIRRVARTGGWALLTCILVYVLGALVYASARPHFTLTTPQLWSPLVGLLVAEVVGLFGVTVLTIFPLSCRKFVHFD